MKAQFMPVHEVFLFAVKPGFRFPAKRPSSVVTVPKVNSNLLVHPNEKPVDLMARLMDSLCPPGGVVLDPFMGSGATAKACVRTGRNYIGFELDESYHALAVSGIAAEVDNLLEVTA